MTSSTIIYAVTKYVTKIQFMSENIFLYYSKLCHQQFFDKLAVVFWSWYLYIFIIISLVAKNSQYKHVEKT